jgi:hypothetical protein
LGLGLLLLLIGHGKILGVQGGGNPLVRCLIKA